MRASAHPPRRGRKRARETVAVTVSVASLLAAALASAPPAAADLPDWVVIDNGTVQLGINDVGDLNAPAGLPSAGGTFGVGLRYLPTNNEATAPGCACEGWGLADALSQVTGYANESAGRSGNLTVESFTATGNSAVSTILIGDTFRVRHDYHPSARTPNLYEVTVTVENISSAAVQPRYRRVMDWDIEPTPFDEYSTIGGTAGAENVLFASDDGFASADPLVPGTQLDFTGDKVDDGPADHGALFDFGFPSLAPGAKLTFNTYYGAAGTEAGAKAALGAVAAEVYSFGQPNTETGPTNGDPNTFVFAFAGVGGAPVVPQVSLSAAGYTVDEGAGTVTVPVVLNTTATAPVSVKYVTAPDTAVAPGDFTHQDGTLVIPAGKSGGTIVVPVVDDTLDEPDERFQIQVSVPDGSAVAGTPTSAWVTIVDNDAPANTAPVATPQSVSTAFETAKAITLAGTDADGDALTFAHGSASHGTLSGTGANLVYTPAAGYSGPDSFTFTVNDGALTSAPATVSITVGAKPNTAPVATAQSVSTAFETAKAITLAGTDTDGDALLFTVGTTPSHGTLSGTAPNLVYTPAAGYSGPDSFTFTVTDGTLTSAPATVSITVGARPNTAPVATAQSVSTAFETAKAITLAGTDAEGDALTFAHGSPAHGTLSGSGANLTYTPAAGYSGPDSFTFTVNDGALTSAPATVSITVGAKPNTAPVATPQSVSTAFETAKAITLAGTDAEGDALTFAHGSPSHGTLSGSGANLTYTPAAGYSGPDSFTFTVNDGALTSAPATVSITVGAKANTAPVATAQSVTLDQGTSKAITLAGTDADGDALTFEHGSPAHGTLSGSGANLTYTPATGYSGPDSFTFTVSDGQATSAPATVGITVAPVIPPSTGVQLDTMVTVDLKRAGSKIVSPLLTTSRPGELILAFVSLDGPTGKLQSAKVTGGGLTWTLASRANTTWGTAEVWQAYATAKLTSVAVTAELTRTGYDGSLTVSAFTGAADKVGATAAASGTAGAPRAVLKPTRTGSLVWATGHDWSGSRAITPLAGQSLVASFRDTRVSDTYWTQKLDGTTTAGTSVTLGVNGFTGDRWQLAGVEILPAG